jgi:hypothetical protein
LALRTCNAAGVPPPIVENRTSGRHYAFDGREREVRLKREQENVMKRLAVGAAALGVVLAAGAAMAGGMAEPIMEDEVIVEEASGSSGGFLVPLLLLVLIAAAVAGSDSSPSLASTGVK